MPVGDERDLASVGRPLWIDVVVVATRETLGLAARHVDQPQAREAVVDEAGAVELVQQRIDEARVGRRRIVRLALRLLLRLGRVRGADNDETATVRRPVNALDIL